MHPDEHAVGKQRPATPDRAYDRWRDHQQACKREKVSIQTGYSVDFSAEARHRGKRMLVVVRALCAIVF